MDIIFSKNEITLTFTDAFLPKRMVLSIWIFPGLFPQHITNNSIKKYNKISNFKQSTTQLEKCERNIALIIINVKYVLILLYIHLYYTIIGSIDDVTVSMKISGFYEHF